MAVEAADPRQKEVWGKHGVSCTVRCRECGVILVEVCEYIGCIRYPLMEGAGPLELATGNYAITLDVPTHVCKPLMEIHVKLRGLRLKGNEAK